MLELRFTAKFRKDYKRIKKQGKDLSKLETTLEALVRGEVFPRLCEITRWERHTAGTASAISSLIGCSSTALMRKGLSSLLRVQEVTASCWGCRYSILHSEEGNNASI